MQHNKFDFETDLIRPMKYFFDFHEIPYYRCHMSNFFMNNFEFEENVDKREKFRKYILNMGYIENQPENHLFGPFANLAGINLKVDKKAQSRYHNNF